MAFSNINVINRTYEIISTIFLFAFFIISILVACSGGKYDNESYPTPLSNRPGELFIPEKGCVPDEETAIKIAEAIWRPIYGNQILEEKPFKAQLINDSVWIVCGSLPDGSVGGVAYIEIRKFNGAIIGLGHGK